MLKLRLTVPEVVVSLVLVISGLSALPAPDKTMVAHEWGTFTALQDDDGTALGAINADDEPVPEFVCRANHLGTGTLDARSALSPGLINSKGIVSCHPDVTMRLETPVIYFYPPAGGPMKPVDVHVAFRGGWLTEFYPRAEASGDPDIYKSRTMHPLLSADTCGSLIWHGVQSADAKEKLTKTDDPVWTAPREVPQAAVVRALPPTGTGTGNTDYRPEKFLFYRGIGHLDSPLRAVRDAHTDRLSLSAGTDMPPGLTGGGVGRPDLHIPAAWLIEIRPEDGRCAFRPVDASLDLGALAGQPLATLPASFTPGEFSAGRLAELQATMGTSLVAAGLTADEAAAMLKTWELSYFKSPGRRLFYLTPRAWTDAVLPLTIDGAAVTRVMVGRIELVTPDQRARLARLAAGPCPDMGEFSSAYSMAVSTAYAQWSRHLTAAGGDPQQTRWERPSLASLKVRVPALYQDYLGLGRFRDALVLREQEQRPTDALTAFVASNQLRAR